MPFAVGFALVGAAVSRPLGPVIQQKITTDANVGDMKIVEVRESLRGNLTAHRVITR